MIRYIKNIFFIFVLINSCRVYGWDKENIYQEIASPWTQKKARNVLLGGTALTLTLVVFFEDSIIDTTQSELIEDNKLGKYNSSIELMGRVVPNALYAASMIGASYFSKTNKNYYLKSAEVMFKATAYAGMATNILKYTVREKRPYGDHRNSFPSGHTTTAFVFASVVAQRHPWYVGVPAYMLATLVAFQRINENRHYLHDVIAGATIGISFGIGINSLLDSKQEHKNLNYSIMPIKGGAVAGLNFSF